MADQARQADRAAVDQRDAEAPAEHAEHGVGRGHPEVAPHRQLQPPGHGMSFHGGDDRFGERQPGGTHRPWSVLGHPVPGPAGDGLEIGTGAEGAGRTGEYGDGGPFVRVERRECLEERIGGVSVHGVAPRRAVDRDDGHRTMTVHSQRFLHGLSMAEEGRRGQYR